MTVRLIIVCLFVSSAAATAGEEVARNWPRFRGPDGTGHSAESNLPTKWDSDSIAWKLELPMSGHSSPVIWGNRIFLTGTTGSASKVQRHVLCLDRDTKKVLWKKQVAEGGGEKLHKMNSWATASCATDGKLVVAFFGPGGLHCFDMDGDLLWKHTELGNFAGSWGVAASPVIIGDMVVQNCDAQGDSYLLAVNKNTGKKIWKTPRRAKPRGGWSTPVLIKTKDHTELLLNGEFGVQSYEPASGKPLWFCKSFNGRGAPAPVFGRGLVYVMNGKPGDVYAVKPGGQGDVTGTHMKWHTGRGGGRDLPSPILTDKYLLVIGMNGIGTGYDAVTGKELWKERLGGNFSASPVAADGKVYAAAEDGTVSVLKVGDKCEVLAKNKIESPLSESFRSSMAVSDGQLFLRSDKFLYCIGNRTQKLSQR